MTFIKIRAQAFDAPEQLVLLLKHPAIHHALQARAQRLEHDDDRGRRHQGVEKEHPQLIELDPLHQKQAVDDRGDHDQGGQHHHAAEQLVEVEQAVAGQGLRQEIQVDGDEDVSERRRTGNEIEQGCGHRRHAADEKVEEPDLLDPRWRAPVAAVEVVDGQIKADEDIDDQGRVKPRPGVDGRREKATEQQRRVEQSRAHHGGTRERRRAGLVAQESLEEPLRGRGKRHRGGHDGPLEQRIGLGRAGGKERQELLDRDVEGEGREENVNRPSRLTQKHGTTDRQADDGGYQGG